MISAFPSSCQSKETQQETKFLLSLRNLQKKHPHTKKESKGILPLIFQRKKQRTSKSGKIPTDLKIEDHLHQRNMSEEEKNQDDADVGIATEEANGNHKSEDGEFLDAVQNEEPVQDVPAPAKEKGEAAPAEASATGDDGGDEVIKTEDQEEPTVEKAGTTDKKKTEEEGVPMKTEAVDAEEEALPEPPAVGGEDNAAVDGPPNPLKAEAEEVPAGAAPIEMNNGGGGGGGAPPEGSSAAASSTVVKKDNLDDEAPKTFPQIVSQRRFRLLVIIRSRGSIGKTKSPYLTLLLLPFSC